MLAAADTEYVAVQYTLAISGEFMEIIFSVNDYPELYEVKVNGLNVISRITVRLRIEL